VGERVTEREERLRRRIVDFIDLLERNIREELAKGGRKLSTEGLASLFGKQTDEIILDAMRSERLSFVGGKLYVQTTRDRERYEVGMEAYFQRADGEWVVKQNRTSPRDLDELDVDSKLELKRLGRIEFELTKPE